jgi:hypothetical protein
VKPVFPTIVIAWLLVDAFKWLLGFHLLVDPTLWLQYKVGYVISSSVDAAVILYLLYRVRGPVESEGSPEPLNVWGWFWRAVVAGFARLAVLLPFASFALPRTSPSEQTVTHLLLLLIRVQSLPPLRYGCFMPPRRPNICARSSGLRGACSDA